MKWNENLLVGFCLFYFVMILSFKVNFFCGLFLFGIIFLLCWDKNEIKDKRNWFHILKDIIIYFLIPYLLSIL